MSWLEALITRTSSLSGHRVTLEVEYGIALQSRAEMRAGAAKVAAARAVAAMVAEGRRRRGGGGDGGGEGGGGGGWRRGWR